MENRRKRTALTRAVIALSAVLCLLVGMTLFLEYRDPYHGAIVPQGNTLVQPQEDISAGLPADDDPVTGDAPEGIEGTPEQGNTPAPQSGLEKEDISVGSDEPDDFEPAGSKPNDEKPAESMPAESNSQESKPVESKPVESRPAGEEGEISSSPTETGPAETVPDKTKDDSNKLGDF